MFLSRQHRTLIPLFGISNATSSQPAITRTGGSATRSLRYAMLEQKKQAERCQGICRSLGILLRNPKPRLTLGPIKHGKVLLQQHIAQDLDIARTGLQTRDALALADVRVHHLLARDDGHVPADLDAEVGELLGAVVERGAVQRRVGGGFDLREVVVDDVLVEVDERGARVGDGRGADLACLLLAADGVGGDVELPEAVGFVDGRVVDVAAVFGFVDHAEFVGALAADLLEVGREDGKGEVGDQVLEEGLLGLRLDGVDGLEGEAQEAVHVLVRLELGGDLGGQFDGLLVDCGTADVNGVVAHDTAGTAAIL